jgi:4-carboxymuconolactone decarboxylase
LRISGLVPVWTGAPGLKNGLTLLKEIEEVLIQALPYIGYPAIARALAAAGVIKEHGLDVDENHRGPL